MAFCTSCGQPAQESARFCRACGAQQVPAPPAAPASAAASPKAKPAGVTVVAVFLILFGVGAFGSLAADLAVAFGYGWTPWVAYNLALALYFMPADIVMAVGLLMGRRWGWKLSVASLYALVYLSLPPLLGQQGLLSATVGNFVQLIIAFTLSMYLASSRNVRAHFGAEDLWLKVGFYKRKARSQ